MSESTTGKSLDPGLKKNLLILGGSVGAAALIVGIFLALRPPPAVAPGQGPTAQLPKATPVGTEKEGPQSEQMTQWLREKQLLEADEARRRGKPYIPPDTPGVEPLPPQPQPQMVGAGPAAAGFAPAQAQNQNGGANPAASEAARQELERRRRGLENQLKDMIAVNAPSQTATRVQFDTSRPATPSAGQAAPSGSGSSSGRAPAGNLLVDALEIFSGSTASPVDTYKTGYISARIVSGSLSGAFLTGRTQLVNEGLQPRFTAMRFNGRTYKVNAIALDEKTATDAVDANLDRRYLQRYVMPVLAAAFGGYASAKAQTGSTVVSVGLGSEGVATPPPTEQQAINAGIAAATTMAQRAIETDAALPIRATFPAGSAIGVMFLEPVEDLDSDPAMLRAAGQQAVTDRSAAAAAAPVRNGLAPATQGVPMYGPPVYGTQTLPLTTNQAGIRQPLEVEAGQ